MFGLQTLSCLHDIPVIRSSTDTIQNVYAKAKQTSPLIRLPCNLAETVADKSLKVALNVVNPLVKPLSGPVRAIDNYAVEKIREIETKYPVINTRPEDVVTTFNERTEPVRNVVNSVRDTTTSTIQQGRQTVANVATGVANSIFSFRDNKQGYQRQIQQLNGCIFSTIGSRVNKIYGKVQSTFIWFRLLIVFVLRKILQVNDVIIGNIELKSYTPVFLLKLLLVFRALLKYVDARIHPSEKQIAELKKAKQQSRYNQKQFHSNRQSSKSNSSATLRQRGNPDLTESTYNVDNDELNTEPIDVNPDDYINELHDRLKTTDVERLYSRLPADIVPTDDQKELIPQVSDDDDDDDEEDDE